MKSGQLPAVCHALQELERDRFPKSGTQHAFISLFGGEWFVTPHLAVRQMLRNPLDASILLPFSTTRRRLRVVKAFIKSGTVRLDTCADVLNVRSHFRRTGLVRSFYKHDGGVTAKVVVSPVDDYQRRIIPNEVSKLDLVRRVGRLTIPRSIDVNLAASSPFFVEEYIDGRTPSRTGDVRILEQKLLPALVAHWQEYGVCARPHETWYSRDGLEDVEDIFSRLDWAESWPNRKAMVEEAARLVASPREFACSFCHADIGAYHIVLNRGGEAALIDWGGGRELPIAVDLAGIERVASQNCGSDLRRQCISALSELQGEKRRHEAYSAQEQLFLAALAPVFRSKELGERAARDGRENSFPKRRLQNAVRQAASFMPGGWAD